MNDNTYEKEHRNFTKLTGRERMLTEIIKDLQMITQKAKNMDGIAVEEKEKDDFIAEVHCRIEQCIAKLKKNNH